MPDQAASEGAIWVSEAYLGEDIDLTTAGCMGHGSLRHSHPAKDGFRTRTRLRHFCRTSWPCPASRHSRRSCSVDQSIGRRALSSASSLVSSGRALLSFWCWEHMKCGARREVSAKKPAAEIIILLYT